MNLKQSKFFYLSLIVLFVSVIALCIYSLLGGFREVVITKKEPVNRMLAGKQFVEHYGNKDWIKFGQQCKDLLDNGQIRGQLIIISSYSDSIPENHLSKFVGIILEDDMVEIPSDFELQTLQSPERYVADLNMHVLVQPRPDKIEKMITAAAQTEGDALQDLFVEIRYPDGRLEVEGWIK